MKKVLKAVKAVGLKTAKSSVNSASFFYMHQVKEPVSVKERLKKYKIQKYNRIQPPMQEDRSAGVAFVINIQNEW